MWHINALVRTYVVMLSLAMRLTLVCYSLCRDKGGASAVAGLFKVSAAIATIHYACKVVSLLVQLYYVTYQACCPRANAYRVLFITLGTV